MRPDLLKTCSMLGLALLLLAPGQTARAGDDQIILWDGTSLDEVTISKEASDKIRYKLRGRSAEVASERVREIVHGEAPEVYQQAEGARNGGRLKRSLGLFETARGDTGAPEWLRPWATFRKAEVGRSLGDAASLDGAVEEYETLLADYADHYLAARGHFGLAEALRNLDRASDSVDHYDALAGGDYGDRWRYMGMYGKGMAMLAQGRNNDARIEFAKISDQSSDPALRSRAAFGMGAALLQEKRYDDAISHFESLKDEALASGAATSPVVAAALVGLAQSYMKSNPDQEETRKRALLAYLEVTVLHAGSGEHYANALYGAAQIYRMMGKQARAEELERELKSQCPDSEPARKIK